MTISQIHAMLLQVGASATEAEDYAEKLHYDWWDAKSPTLDAARIRLNDWRREKRQLAALFRADRQRHIDAGYRGPDPAGPIYLNGKTAW